ncbi:MAG: FAD/NAD(P)-binding protein [Candidatus Woesearchaeota archaeon]
MGLFSRKILNPYASEEYSIKSIKKLNEDTALLTIKTKMNPMPGQFLQVNIPMVGEAPISNASYNHKELELLVRNVGNVTNHILNLNKNDKIRLRGPYGHGYPMNEMHNCDIVLIGGGTGTAPPRSVIQYIQKHRNNFGDVIIFFGFRGPKEILFQNDFAAWQKDFKFYLTVDKADPGSGYEGKVGLVTDLIEQTNLPEKAKVILCGPPIMIKFSIEKLLKKGIREDNIYISMERHMKCGIQKCGHCMIHDKYSCKDGPVFKYNEIKNVTE